VYAFPGFRYGRKITLKVMPNLDKRIAVGFIKIGIDFVKDSIMDDRDAATVTLVRSNLSTFAEWRLQKQQRPDYLGHHPVPEFQAQPRPCP
jgi:hypothetical protein